MILSLKIFSAGAIIVLVYFTMRNVALEPPSQENFESLRSNTNLRYHRLHRGVRRKSGRLIDNLNYKVKHNLRIMGF